MELSNDEEAMAALAEADAPDPEERLAEWSPEVRLLALVADRVGELIHVFVQANGGKPGQFKPLPRPQTAFEAAKYRRQMRDVEELRNSWAPSPEPGG